MVAAKARSSVAWVDHKKMVYVIAGKDGRRCLPLEKGGDGFACVKLPSGKYLSLEVSNLSLDLHAKIVEKESRGKPADVPAELSKKPAGAASSLRRSAAAKMREPLGAEKAKGYRLENYKKPHLVGVRQKFLAKRQICTFGGKHCDKKQELLMLIGKAAVERLEAGDMTEAETKAWCQELLSKSTPEIEKRPCYMFNAGHAFQIFKWGPPLEEVPWRTCIN